MQDLWRVVDQGYDAFWDEFEAYLRRMKRRGNHRRANQRIPVDISDWTERSRRRRFSQQEKLWRRMTKQVDDYDRVQYSGHLFRTHTSEIDIKTCNSILRIDYNEHDGDTVAAYGRIVRLFSHQMFPGGPTRLVAECDWYMGEGKESMTGLPMLSINPDSNFNRRSRFTFFESVYSRPCAVWPLDPYGELDAADPRRDYFLAIDRNEPYVESE